jgi:glycosyltransferase involved in cell wall biosynthesis
MHTSDWLPSAVPALNAPVWENPAAVADQAKLVRQRVLMVAYLFPPVGGAGVQRAAKFVKYLHHFGWYPSVVTTANPSVPLLDASLLADIPAGTPIRRARTWEPGYALKSAVSATCTQAPPARSFRRALRGWARRAANLLLQPDPQVLWVRQAIRAGKQMLRDLPHTAILVTGPPFSSFLVGARLSRWSGLPLILDYRDEWSISNAYWENKRPDRFSRFVQTRMQRRVMRQAKVLLATTRSSAEALEKVRQEAGSNARVGWIYNGYDAEDFADTPPPPCTDRCFRLVYTGTLWELTSVRPLVEAVQRLAQRQPALVTNLELVFAGRRTQAQQQLLERLRGLPCRLVEHPYLDHRDAVQLLRSADGLCTLLSDLPGAGRVVPAKIFEYIAAKRPLLTIAPRGELWDLLHEHPVGQLCEPGDVEGVTAWLAHALQHHRAGSSPGCPDWKGLRHDRLNQARQLADLLDRIQGT